MNTPTLNKRRNKPACNRQRTSRPGHALLFVSTLWACGGGDLMAADMRDTPSAGQKSDPRVSPRETAAAPSRGESQSETTAGTDTGQATAIADADAGVATAAIGPPRLTTRANLVDHQLWEPVAASDDPSDDRPAPVVCDPAASKAEPLGAEITYGVETALCNYLAVQQPSLHALHPGDLVQLRLWHFALTADEPAEAHAAVSIAGLTVLDTRIPIPSEGGLIATELRISESLPAGAPVHFHLHNHGENSWALVEISAGP